MKLSESAIQSQIRGYLAVVGIDAVHVPNGSVLAGDVIARAKQSNALKKAGMMPGFADLILLDRRFVRRVGFVEVKAEGGRQSPAQKDFEDHAVCCWGIPYAICRSVEDVIATLAEWGWRV